MSTFPQDGNHSFFCRTSILESAIYKKWVIASSSKVILARPSRHSATRTFTSGTSGPRWFSLILLHERIRRRIWWCIFFHAYSYRGGNCNCLLSNTARLFPIVNNLQECFLHAVLFLIIDHGVLLQISIAAPKILISNFLLDTSFHQSFQSVIVRS